MQDIVKLMTSYKNIDLQSIKKNLPIEMLKDVEILENSFSQQEILEYIFKTVQECLTKVFDRFLNINDLESFNLTIITRQGGQDAQELSQQILKMYLAFLDRTQINYKIIDIKKAETGIHQAIISVFNTQLFPYLIYETGIHRVERYSPYKRQKKIYTSSIEVNVTPTFSKPDIRLSTKLIKMKPIKASGPGGQYVNKAMTGVLINYNGINIRVSTYRSFEQNKKQALQILKSKILFNQLLNSKKKSSNLYKLYSTNQIIRTYDLVFNYVKLHRQKIKIKKATAILKGEIIPILMYNILYATRQTCNKTI